MSCGLGRPYSAVWQPRATECPAAGNASDSLTHFGSAQKAAEPLRVPASAPQLVRRPPADGRPPRTVKRTTYARHRQFGPAPAGAESIPHQRHCLCAPPVRRPPTDGRPRTPLESEPDDGLMLWRSLNCMNASIALVLPNVRAKLATTVGRAGQRAQNGPQAQRLMASVTRRWRSA